MISALAHLLHVRQQDRNAVRMNQSDFKHREVRAMKNDSQANAVEGQLSCHACDRMEHRNIGQEAIEEVLAYGREVYTRGAVVYAIGRREIKQWEEQGVDLSKHNGLQVITAHDGKILTIYRNRNFRGLRTGLGRGRYKRTLGLQTA